MDDLLDWRLLLVIAVFGAGWAIARVDMEQVVSKARVVPGLIMDGIGNLLRGERVAAASSFLQAGQPLSQGNAELHFAAGELFRIQGRYEEAIRVHKAMLAAEDLNADTRTRARYELGLDYQKGGFLDLAEQCFSRLEGTEYADASLRHLCNIHLYSRDWERAIADEERFAKDDISSELCRHVIAQLYCEWASEAKGARRDELLAEAVKRNPNCSRAWIMRLDDAVTAKNRSDAFTAIDNIKRTPSVIPLCTALVMEAYQQADSAAEGARWLAQVFQRHPSVLMFDRIYEAVADVWDRERLQAFVDDAMQSLDGEEVVARWLETRGLGDAGGQYAEPRRALGDARASFTCSSCDFEAKHHYWQCPVCRSWETMLPQTKDMQG